LQRYKVANPSKSLLCNAARRQIHRNHRFATLQGGKFIGIIALQRYKVANHNIKVVLQPNRALTERTKLY
jgi:hypothetical protein